MIVDRPFNASRGLRWTVVTTQKEKIFENFRMYENDNWPYRNIIVNGLDKLAMMFKSEQVDIYRSDENSLGAMLLYLTGSKSIALFELSRP